MSATSASPLALTVAWRRCVRQLRNGQTVEIITKPNSRPNPAWLDFVVTGKARATIRSFLKRLEHKEAVDWASVCLIASWPRQGQSLDDVGEVEIAEVLQELGVESFDALLEQVGLGNRMAKLVARLLVTTDEGHREGSESVDSLKIRGTEGMVVSFAKCCGPIPGDPVVAIFSPGRGLVVHHHDCPNLGDFRRQGQSWLDVQWAPDVDSEFSTTLRIDAGNQRGMLATIASVISDEGSNIEDVRSEERDGLSMSLRFVVSVRHRKHLAKHHSAHQGRAVCAAGEPGHRIDRALPCRYFSTGLPSSTVMARSPRMTASRCWPATVWRQPSFSTQSFSPRTNLSSSLRGAIA
jgi:guanosine-3',5'-bis(diphosphate) 3'-pyrophosphohydrolase